LVLLDVAERYADGLAAADEYKAAKQAVSRMAKRDILVYGADGPPNYGQILLGFLRLKDLPAWEGVAPHEYNYLSDEARRNRENMRRGGMRVITEEQAVEVQRQHDAFMECHTTLLRDIFGNPFRPVTLDPRWLQWNDSTVPRMARAIYDARRFADMPILADALMDAGCHNEDILTHCRQPGDHVRGCWVLDVLLDKK
jgi:hypothetical protein